jgi:hypothetical protein
MATATATKPKPRPTKVKPKARKTPVKAAPATKAAPNGTAKKTTATAKRGTGAGTKATPVKTTAAKATTTRKAPAKAAPAKVEAKPKQTTGEGRTVDLHGFTPGTDSSLIAEALVEGGETRVDVNRLAAEKIAKVNGIKTRQGSDKNVPSLLSSILKRLQAQGYTIESSWRLVPPPEVETQIKKEAAAAKRRATRAAKAK